MFYLWNKINIIQVLVIFDCSFIFICSFLFFFRGWHPPLTLYVIYITTTVSTSISNSSNHIKTKSKNIYSMNNQTNWNTLKENGYIVLPILDQKRLKYYMEKMHNDLLVCLNLKLDIALDMLWVGLQL